ncbi:MAG TPA: hypothetical protein DF715_14180, partial [Oceanicaulis sp.]|nr:hypothetical protein [Oceanicaulis sp.]
LGGGSEANFDYTTAVGSQAIADAAGANAFGYDAQATATNAFALGRSARAGGTDAMALGREAEATGTLSIAFGQGSASSGFNTIALGSGSNASATGAMAMGALAQASGLSSTALGFLANASALNAMAFGRSAAASGDEAIAIGSSASAAGLYALAFGREADAQNFNSMAFGRGATVTADNAVAIGAFSQAVEEDTVSFGDITSERRLVNVADGIADTDAATVGQLNALTGGSGVTFDSFGSDIASFFGGGAAYAAGAFTAPAYVIQGTSFGDVGSAFAALDGKVTENATEIQAIKDAAPPSGDSSAEIAALQAQIEALQAQMQAQMEALQQASTQLAELQTGGVQGGQTSSGNDIAIGSGAQAGSQDAGGSGLASASADMGPAQTGSGSIAIGVNAQATNTNAIAIGSGAETTRDNQVVIGTASNTYTFAGINSAASRAAQSGPTYMVTSDASGNLATMDFQPWFDRVDGLETSVAAQSERLRDHSDGIAMAMALSGATILQPGQSFAFSANYGHYSNSGAVGFGAIGRYRENVFLNVGVGTGFRTGQVAGRAGVSWGW